MKSAYLYNPLFLEHDELGHPENAKRLRAIMDYLTQYELLSALQLFEGRPATEEELLLCHHRHLVSLVKNSGSADHTTYLDPDTYMNSSSYRAALHAVGGLIDMVDALLDGRITNGIALVRPPGHHATVYKSMGFCLFNSIAIAAAYAVKNRGLERVAIVDYDVHHGNGTQDIFRKDKSVLYISSHGYPMYPGTGHYTETGEAEAKGTLINIPLPSGSGDNNYRAAYSRVVFPALRRFQPQLILVSAGFDAHFADPLAYIDLSLQGFHWLNQRLMELAAELCDDRLIFTLEGGYNLKVLGPVTGNLLRTMTGSREMDDPLGPGPGNEPDISGLIDKLLSTHGIED